MFKMFAGWFSNPDTTVHSDEYGGDEWQYSDQQEDREKVSPEQPHRQNRQESQHSRDPQNDAAMQRRSTTKKHSDPFAPENSVTTPRDADRRPDSPRRSEYEPKMSSPSAVKASPRTPLEAMLAKLPALPVTLKFAFANRVGIHYGYSALRRQGNSVEEIRQYFRLDILAIDFAGNQAIACEDDFTQWLKERFWLRITELEFELGDVDALPRTIHFVYETQNGESDYVSLRNYYDNVSEAGFQLALRVQDYRGKREIQDPEVKKALEDWYMRQIQRLEMGIAQLMGAARRGSENKPQPPQPPQQPQSVSAQQPTSTPVQPFQPALPQQPQPTATHAQAPAQPAPQQPQLPVQPATPPTPTPPVAQPSSTDPQQYTVEEIMNEYGRPASQPVPQQPVVNPGVQPTPQAQPAPQQPQLPDQPAPQRSQSASTQQPTPTPAQPPQHQRTAPPEPMFTCAEWAKLMQGQSVNGAFIAVDSLKKNLAMWLDILNKNYPEP